MQEEAEAAEQRRTAELQSRRISAAAAASHVHAHPRQVSGITLCASFPPPAGLMVGCWRAADPSHAWGEGAHALQPCSLDSAAGL
jgi:hypothetical protein